MAEDLLAVLDQLGVERTWIAAHDWGGPPAFILLLRHPQRVAGFAGFNTVAPWLKLDGPNLRHAWAYYYQFPLMVPRIIGSPAQRYQRWLTRWSGGGYDWPEQDAEIYLSRLRDPARAYAGSQWYRTFLTSEFLSWSRGGYAGARVEVPLRWVTGLKDPTITPVLHRGYETYADDIAFEHIPDARSPEPGRTSPSTGTHPWPGSPPSPRTTPHSASSRSARSRVPERNWTRSPAARRVQEDMGAAMAGIHAVKAGTIRIRPSPGPGT